MTDSLAKRQRLALRELNEARSDYKFAKIFMVPVAAPLAAWFWLLFFMINYTINHHGSINMMGWWVAFCFVGIPVGLGILIGVGCYVECVLKIRKEVLQAQWKYEDVMAEEFE